MPAIASDRPTQTEPQNQSREHQTEAREDVIARFQETVVAIAEQLGDMTTPLRHSHHNRDRFLVEDAFAYLWKESKRQLGGDNDESAKGILRAAGGSGPFMNAIHSIVHSDVGNSQRHRDEQAQRFSVALRLAVHLSPDHGAAIYQELDRLLHPARSSCPLSVLNAYLAHKVRGAQG